MSLFYMDGLTRPIACFQDGPSHRVDIYSSLDGASLIYYCNPNMVSEKAQSNTYSDSKPNSGHPVQSRMRHAVIYQFSFGHRAQNCTINLKS